MPSGLNSDLAAEAPLLMDPVLTPSLSASSALSAGIDSFAQLGPTHGRHPPGEVDIGLRTRSHPRSRGLL